MEESVKRAFVLDIGSASVRLIIGIADNAQDISISFNQGIVTRLREALNYPDGLMSAHAGKTLDGISRLLKLAGDNLPEKGACLCTQAVRQADMREKFLERVHEITGITPEILSAEQEGMLAWRGSLDLVDKSSVLIDLGGGSTEFIWLDGVGSPCVRSVPLAAATGDVASTEEVLPVWKTLIAEREIPTFSKAVLLGGTASSYAGMHCRAETYSRDRLHGMTIPAEFFGQQATLLSGMPISIRKRVPGLESGREVIAVNGGYHYSAIIELLRIKTVTISEQGIRFGRLLGMLGKIG